MLTDAPPRKANRAQFLESDQMETLDLPKNGRLPSITKSIESAMKSRKGSDVRRACTEFLETASEFYRGRELRDPRPCSTTPACPRTRNIRTFW
jgi:hypothetical protein